MELAVDAAQSRQLPEFLERFAGRVARMLNAGITPAVPEKEERTGMLIALACLAIVAMLALTAFTLFKIIG